MRRLVGFVIVLVILLVAVDRVAWLVAQRGVADSIQSSADLATRPDVKVRGFPFLTQVIKGRYDHVDGTLDDLSVQDGLTVDQLKVQLNGVHVTLGELIHRTISSAPVDSASATATVSYDSIDQVAKANLPGRGLDVEFTQGRAGLLSVTGTYSSSLIKTQINGDAQVLIQNGELVVRVVPESLDRLPVAVRSEVTPLLGGSYRLPSLPFGFKAKSVSVEPNGIAVLATATSVHLGSLTVG
jgi:hypothetical protein